MREELYDEKPKFNLEVATSKLNDEYIMNLDELSELYEEDSYTDNKNPLYSVFISLNELDTEDESKVKGKVFESELILFPDNISKEDLLYYADEDGSDEYIYAEALLKTKEFKRDLYDYDDEIAFHWGKDVVSGALHRFYVYPEYRKLGIGKQMINLIDKILERKLDIKLRCLMTLVKPDDGQEKNMEKLMIKNIKDNGFKKIHGVDKCYIRDYLEEYYG